MSSYYKSANAAGNSPCFGCSDRHRGCHKDCKPYLDWKAEIEKIRNLKIKSKDYSYAAYVREKNNRIKEGLCKSSLEYRRRFKADS